MTGNSHKLHQEFRLDLRKKIFTEGVVALELAAQVEPPSLEVVKKHVDLASGDMA